MTLEEAKQCIKEGFPFGDVYPEVISEEKQALKDWYVREEGLPKLSARGGYVETKVIEFVPTTIRAVPDQNGVGRHAERTMGYTGDTCHKCQGCRMVRTGPCLRCEDCGETSGGCG